jgi:hypothetical protein
VSFNYRKDYMAQALSVIGNAGIHGMEYNGSLVSWGNKSYRFKSKRFRFSLFEAHSFSGDEFENYMILAWRMGLVERSRYSENSAKHGVNKSAYPLDGEIIRLTPKGWDFTEKYDRPLLQRWGRNIADNVPTIFLSVASSLLAGWAIFLLGAPQ